MAAKPVRIAILADGKNARREFEATGRSGSRMGQLLGKAGKATAYGIGAGLTLAAGAAAKFAQQAAEDQTAAALLARQLKASAGATDAQVKATENYITQQGKLYGVTDDDLRPALAKLVVATHDVTKARQLATLAENVAAGKGKSLAQVSEALAKGVNGQVAGLSRLGVKTKDAAGNTKTLAAIVKDLHHQFDGAAATKAGTLQGQIDRLKVAASEAGEALGYKLLPLATKALNGITSHEDDIRHAASEVASFGQQVGREVLPPLKELAADGVAVVRFFDGLPGPVKKLGAEAAAAAFAMRALQNSAALGGIQRFTAGVRSAETRTTALASAARTASGIGGLAALTDAAGRSQGPLQSLEKTAGYVALGFSVAGPWGAAIAGVVGLGTELGKLAGVGHQIDFSDLDRSLTALTSGRPSRAVNELVGDLKLLKIVGSDKTLESNLDGLDQSLAHLVESGQSGKAAAIFSALVAQAGDAGVSLETVRKYTDAYGLALSNVKVGPGFSDADKAAIAAATSAADAAGANHRYAGSLRDGATAAGAQTRALAGLVEQMHHQKDAAASAFDAETQYRQALKDATAAGRANSAGIRGNSDAALENRTRLAALRDAWNNQSAAVKNNGKEYRTARQDFIDSAEAMGVPKRAAKALADQVLDIPKSREIKIAADNRRALEAVRETQRRLDAMRDRHLSIFVNTVNGQNRGGKGGIDDDPSTPQRVAASAQTEAQKLLARLIKGYDQGTEGVGKVIDRLNQYVDKSLDKALAQTERTLQKHLKGKALQSALRAAEKDAAADHRAVTKAIRDEERALNKNARAQDRVSKKLEGARSRLQAAKDAYHDYARGIRDAIVATGDLTTLGQTQDAEGNTVAATAGSIIADLKAKVAQARQFARLIRKLTEEGLNKTSLQQLLAAGADGGLATAQALAAGGQAAVNQINALTSQLTQTGTKLGTSAADTLKKGAIDAAEAYVATLEKRKKRLILMEEVKADAYVLAVARALKKAGVKGQGPIIAAALAALRHDQQALRNATKPPKTGKPTAARPSYAETYAASPRRATQTVNLTVTVNSHGGIGGPSEFAIGREVVKAVDTYLGKGGQTEHLVKR